MPRFAGWPVSGASRSVSSATGARAATAPYYYGRAFTRVKDRKAEIGKGLLAKMLDDLGIDPKDFSGGRR